GGGGSAGGRGAGDGPAPRRGARSDGTGSDPARGVAYEVFRAVSERGSYANLLLPKLLQARRVTGRDADLATELTYGGLRVRGTPGAGLARRPDPPPGPLDPPPPGPLPLGAPHMVCPALPDHAPGS